MHRLNPLLTIFVIIFGSIILLCSSQAYPFQKTTTFGNAINSFTHKSQKIFIALTGRQPGQKDAQIEYDNESFKLNTSLPEDALAFDAGPLSFQHSHYTADLIIPHFGSEDLSWLSQLPSAIHPIIYTHSSSSQTLPPHASKTILATKGHEALTYLTHITTHYDVLPDILIFTHPHPTAWHNNDLLSLSTALTLSRLNPHHVLAAGYFNLRCHWDPGCPTYLHPSSPDPALLPGSDALRQEEPLVAAAWSDLFPAEPVPADIAQPCCGQFAVSRAQVRAQPRARYARVKGWLEETALGDEMSGRVLEYLWGYLFSGREVSCPDMRSCYCGAYGVCFGSEEGFQGWFEMKWRRGQYLRELERWALSEREVDKFRRQGRVDEVALMDKLDPGRIDWLEREIRGLEEKMERVKREAWERGRDPKNREID
ncbi:hypothetical protein EV356DRAFT_508280 [Viridothelium virens]|uniref:Uncharacterized protein n=1 Tax=Viridothelium virens TaxID=1048519 RepID=A0A6A6GZC4_VIRVR|nr:hypothetical protein EV356DRAFT_508280 [Viridothelium virens]